MDRLGIGLVARGVAGEEEEVGPLLPHQELHQRIGAHGAAERRVEDVREAGGDAQVVVADAAVEDQRVRCLGMSGDGQQVIAWQIGDEEAARSEEHTSELQSLMRNSYAVFCLKKKNKEKNHNTTEHKYV